MFLKGWSEIISTLVSPKKSKVFWIYIGFFNNEDDFVLEAEYNNQLKDNQVFEKTTNSADQKIVT